MPKDLEKECVYCKTLFLATPKRRLYCSDDCRLRGKTFVKECEQCHNSFEVFYSRAYKANKFCCKACYTESQKQGKPYPCKGCGKEVLKSPSIVKYSKKVYCSQACYDEMRDRNSRNLAENRRLGRYEHQKKRGFNNSKILRNYVFSVKPKSCEVCSYSEHDFCIEIHHKDKNCLNNHIDNLAVLCVICHRKLHKNLISLSDIKPVISVIDQAQDIVNGS